MTYTCSLASFQLARSRLHHRSLQSAQPDPTKQRIGFLATVFTVCLVLVALVVNASPNFQTIDGVRAAPLGGDFLQDWVGGSIVQSEHKDHLYDKDYFRKVQHDPDLVGFEWNQQKYYPPLYSPGYYLVVSPLSTIPYQFSVYIWLLFSILCLGATFCLLYWGNAENRRVLLWFVIASVLFSPLLLCLNIGHKSTFILLALTVTFLLLKSERSFLAGLSFGLIAFKPQLLMVLLLVMLLRRDWKFIVGFSTTGVAWLAACLIAGPNLTLDYFAVLLGSTDYSQNLGYDFAMSQSIWSFVESATTSHSLPFGKVIAGLLCLVVRSRLAGRLPDRRT